MSVLDRFGAESNIPQGDIRRSSPRSTAQIQSSVLAESDTDPDSGSRPDHDPNPNSEPDPGQREQYRKKIEVC